MLSNLRNGRRNTEVINPRYADITFTSNQAGFTVIETIPDKEIHTFYANDGTKTKFVFDD